MERDTMRNGHLILTAAILALLFFSPAYAQDAEAGMITASTKPKQRERRGICSLE